MQYMEKIMACFKEQQVVSFATSDGNQPRVRPMSLIHIDDGFYMITGARGGRDAKKLQQLGLNPRFEYYLALKGKNVDGFIRGMGEASEVVDEASRKKVYDRVEWAARYFDSPSHPDYVLLELKHNGFSYRAPDTQDIYYV